MAVTLIKICSICGRIRHYHKGDNLPVWEYLDNKEWNELEKNEYMEHHTICPICRGKNG